MADLIHVQDKAQAKTILGDGDGKADASILIGGNMTNRFWPTIQAGKWKDKNGNNEAWLSISRKGVDIPRGEFGTFQNGRMELITGSIRDVYYTTPNGHLEYEISFNDSLPTHIDLALDFPDGMSFWKQLALTEEEIEEGQNRPENVIDSYAVYWCKNNNKYKTGKHSHVYRCFLKDANNNWVWCDQKIENNVWRIIPGNEEWLRSAIYPITVGPTLGYDTAGSSNASNSGRTRYVGENTDGSGGNVQNFHVAVFDTGVGGFKMGIYDDDGGPGPGNLLEQVEWTPGVSNNENTPSIDQDLLAGSTMYWVGSIAENVSDPRIKYDGGQPMAAHKRDSAVYANEMLNPAGATVTNASVFSIWIDYIPAAGGIVPILEHHYRMMRNQ